MKTQIKPRYFIARRIHDDNYMLIVFNQHEKPSYEEIGLELFGFGFVIASESETFEAALHVLERIFSDSSKFIDGLPPYPIEMLNLTCDAKNLN